MLNTIHNVRFYLALMERIRTAIPGAPSDSSRLSGAGWLDKTTNPSPEGRVDDTMKTKRRTNLDEYSVRHGRAGGQVAPGGIWA